MCNLKIFDNTGKEISTLINEYNSAGFYNVKFDGRAFSSGVYFYRIAVYSDKLSVPSPSGGIKNFSGTKKMLLLK